MLRRAAALHLLSACALTLLCASSATALELPTLQRPVTDLAGLLTEAQRGELEAKLAAYEQSTGHQFAVVTIATLEGEVIADFAIRLAEKWKLGDARRDDGLLLVVAVKEHDVRIEVGHGLEGAIPDVTAGRIIQEIIVPRFRAGDFAGGINAAIDALMRAAAGESLGPPTRSRGADRVRGQKGLINIMLMGGMVLFFLSAVTRRLKRPLRAALLGVTGAGIGILLGAMFAGVLGVFGLLLGLMNPGLGGRGGGFMPGGFYGGGFRGGGGGFGGGGFGGGGGSFGGGGASGRW